MPYRVQERLGRVGHHKEQFKNAEVHGFAILSNQITLKRNFSLIINGIITISSFSFYQYPYFFVKRLVVDMVI